MLLDYLEGPASRAGTAWLLPHMRRSVPRGDGGAVALNDIIFSLWNDIAQKTLKRLTAATTTHRSRLISTAKKMSTMQIASWEALPVYDQGFKLWSTVFLRKLTLLSSPSHCGARVPLSLHLSPWLECSSLATRGGHKKSVSPENYRTQGLHMGSAPFC